MESYTPNRRSSLNAWGLLAGIFFLVESARGAEIVAAAQGPHGAAGESGGSRQAAAVGEGGFQCSGTRMDRFGDGRVFCKKEGDGKVSFVRFACRSTDKVRCACDPEKGSYEPVDVAGEFGNSESKETICKSLCAQVDNLMTPTASEVELRTLIRARFSPNQFEDLPKADFDNLRILLGRVAHEKKLTWLTGTPLTGVPRLGFGPIGSNSDYRMSIWDTRDQGRELGTLIFSPKHDGNDSLQMEPR